MLNAGVMTAVPSFSGVLYLLQAAASSFEPAFLNITPQIPPPSQRPLFAALTTASTFWLAQDALTSSILLIFTSQSIILIWHYTEAIFLIRIRIF